jgi:succinate dehydrogenase hydrophobic anchor subunit
MDEINPPKHLKRLRWGEHDPHRRENTMVGMWAWLAQRVSAVALVVLVVLHLALTYNRVIQLLLLLAIAFHASLGLRVILLDFNIVSVKYHKALAWGLTTLGLLATYGVWRAIY